MRYQCVYTQQAVDDLAELPKTIARRIVKKIDFFISQKQPLRFAKKLKDARIGTYRYRVGDYRIIFDINNNATITIVMVLLIRHRREVYRFVD